MLRLGLVTAVVAATCLPPLVIASDDNKERSAAEVPARPSDEKIDAWIPQLGDDDPAVRDKAAKALIEAGPWSGPAVHKAMQSKEYEVRLAAERISAELEKRAAKAFEDVGGTISWEPRRHVRAVSFRSKRQNTLKDDDLANLLALPQLMTLNLEDTRITDRGLRWVGCRHGLDLLKLSNTSISDAGLEHISGLSSLRRLDLTETGITGSGFVFLHELRSLENLGCTRAGITDEGLREGIGGIAQLPKLREISFLDTPLTDAGVNEIARLKSLPKSLSLRLGSETLTDDGLRGLAALPNLELLDLRNAAITDAGMLHVAKIKNLRGLLLDGMPVSDHGLRQLETLPKLKQLWIGKTRITYQQGEAFRLRRKVEISWLLTNENP